MSFEEEKVYGEEVPRDETLLQVIAGIQRANMQSGTPVDVAWENGGIRTVRPKTKTVAHFDEAAIFNTVPLTQGSGEEEESSQGRLRSAHKNAKSVVKSAISPYLDNSEQSESESVITLSQLAESIGIAQQHIVNLIIRFDVVKPQKSTAFSPRETYVFDAQEANTVRRIFRLRHERGKPVREAVEMLENDEKYRESAQKLQKALFSYARDRESLADIVEAIIDSPRFTEQERNMLLEIEAYGKQIVQAAAATGLSSESEATGVLKNAYSKVGETLFDLLFLSLEDK